MYVVCQPRVALSALAVFLGVCGAGCQTSRDTRSAQERAQPAEWGHLGLEVPVAGHSVPMPGAANADSLRIAIKEDGTVYLGSFTASTDEIPPKAKDMLRSNPGAGVYLWADRRARQERCGDVLDDLRVAGVSNVGLITRQQERQDASETAGNSVPRGEVLLLVDPPPPGVRHDPSGQYPLWDHGRLIAPIFIPKEIAGPGMCRTGWTQACTVVLRVGRGGNLILNTEPVRPEHLGDRLVEVFKTRATKAIFLIADPDLDYGTVVNMVDIAHGAGIESVGMIPEM